VEGDGGARKTYQREKKGGERRRKKKRMGPSATHVLDG